MQWYDRTLLLIFRVTTGLGSILQHRVPCRTHLEISGGWYGIMTYRPLWCSLTWWRRWRSSAPSTGPMQDTSSMPALMCLWSTQSLSRTLLSATSTLSRWVKEMVYIRHLASSFECSNWGEKMQVKPSKSWQTPTCDYNYCYCHV